jgi:Arc/MetJ family transcription regulator
MRTNIEIDDDLMARAVELSGLKTKRATVEQGLRLLIKLKEQERIGDLFGKVRWQGDLEESRRGRLPG